jgi:hypothetical protein
MNKFLSLLLAIGVVAANVTPQGTYGGGPKVLLSYDSGKKALKVEVTDAPAGGDFFLVWGYANISTPNIDSLRAYNGAAPVLVQDLYNSTSNPNNAYAGNMQSVTTAADGKTSFTAYRKLIHNDRTHRNLTCGRSYKLNWNGIAPTGQ